TADLARDLLGHQPLFGCAVADFSRIPLRTHSAATAAFVTPTGSSPSHSDVNSATRLRPECLARYRARSLRCSSESTSKRRDPSSIATPALSVTDRLEFDT